MKKLDALLVLVAIVSIAITAAVVDESRGVPPGSPPITSKPASPTPEASDLPALPQAREDWRERSEEDELDDAPRYREPRDVTEEYFIPPQRVGG